MEALFSCELIDESPIAGTHSSGNQGMEVGRALSSPTASEVSADSVLLLPADLASERLEAPAPEQ